MPKEYKHIPVLRDQSIDALNVQKGATFVDATLGGAGHSLCVAPLLGAGGVLIGIDQDDVALKAAGQRLDALEAAPHIELLRGNFGDLDDLLISACVPGIDAILFDIGVSSVQIDTPERGFSFKQDGPLDMRMSPDAQTLTAEAIVNTYSCPRLTRIFKDYGEEKWASRIAQFICEAREHQVIKTSAQLVEIIKAAVPASARRSGGHPAKRVFQALRIEVNAELDVLERALHASVRWLNSGGRVAVISYHSLEDKIVKSVFASYVNRCTCPPDLPVCMCNKTPILKLITKKPIVASAEEIERNPRARSAKLRVAEKI